MNTVSNRITNLVSTKNSSNIPLIGNGIYLGTIEQISKYNAVSTIVTSDTNGTLEMQFSADGVNIDRIKKVVVTDNTTHTLAIVSKFFRIKYTNGSTNQTYFRLQTILHEKTIKMLTSTSNQIIDDNNDVELMRNINLPKLDIARNLYKDKSSIHITGRNTGVGTTEEDVWFAGGPYPWPLLPETIRIKAGGNVNDTAAGTGARSVYVEGLDANYLPINETLITAGASASAASTQLFKRIYKAYVVSTGTRTATNLGDIFIENTTSLNSICEIGTGYGVTELSMYTIPAGKKGYITTISANVDAAGSKVGTVSLNVMENNTAIAAPFSAIKKINIFDDFVGMQEIRYHSYIEVPEKTDIWCSAVSTGAGTKVDINYDLIVTT